MIWCSKIHRTLSLSVVMSMSSRRAAKRSECANQLKYGTEHFFFNLLPSFLSKPNASLNITTNSPLG